MNSGALIILKNHKIQINQNNQGHLKKKKEQKEQKENKCIDMYLRRMSVSKSDANKPFFTKGFISNI